MRFLRQSLTGLFLLSLTLGLLVWAGVMVRDAVQTRLSAETRMPAARERVFAVNVIVAEPQKIVPVLTALGDVESRRTLELRAAAPGQVVEVAKNFEDGATVEAEQVLVRIDPADAQDAVSRARADLRDAEAEQAQARAAIELARDELTAAQQQAELRDTALRRQQDLTERGVGTAAAEETAELAASAARQAVLVRRQALAAAEARLSQSATALDRARIALAEAERALADTIIRARFSGTLSDVAVVEGGLLSDNEQIAKLVDPDALEVAFRVPTQAFARLLDSDGVLQEAPVHVTLDVMGGDLEADGVLVRSSAAVGEGQTGRLLFARLDKPRGLKPGDFVTVQINEPALDDVIRLPASALDAAGSVLLIGEEERLEEHLVRLERRQGNDVLVRAPDIAGREVVAERTPLLGAGIRVRPLRPQSEAEAMQEAPDLLDLTDERREKLRAFVTASQRMPEDAKARLLGQLDQPRVPAQVVARIEARMGG